MALERGQLLADEASTGAAWCRAHSDLVDAWLVTLLDAAGAPPGPPAPPASPAPPGPPGPPGHAPAGVALVAVGGYGRAELCPQSDIDLMLLHDRPPDVVGPIADRVWYPIWDEGLHLGHSVCTVREALVLAADDLDTATALLNTRHVAGDQALTVRLADQAATQWARRAKRWLTELGATVEVRHEAAGETAFLLEPDLKEGRGGLRDVHALRWAEAAGWHLREEDAPGLEADYRVLLDARVELQRRTGRPGNVLTLEDQDAVAAALGVGDADDLMRSIADAARRIAWTSDDTWRRVRSSLRGPLGRLQRRSRSLGGGLQLRDGDVQLDDGPPPGDEGDLPLRVAAAAAAEHTVIDRDTLERLSLRQIAIEEPWGATTRAAFVALLLAGRPAIRVIEALDQRSLWARFVPEWDAVRSRPQRNPYHRFTVDRHLLETAANAARLAAQVARPDLLVVAALLHDLGKGYPGDHSLVGAERAAAVARRMGFDHADVETLVLLVRLHLLLPDVATRRDLDDPTTIERVAIAVGTVEVLALLAALTEADSLATGPAAWGSWKAGLVALLVDRVDASMTGGEPGGVAVESFPNPAQLERLAEPGRTVEFAGDALVVMNDDRAGTFSRIAGTLALHGLDVQSASAYSTESGRALAEFRVTDPRRGRVAWGPVVDDLHRVLDGRLALSARLHERARVYGRNRTPGLAHVAAVTFDHQASADSLVIDVQAADAVGVLYRITRALAELDLDIRSAKVQTLGPNVVDAFYVRDASGAKITDPAMLGEIERAILHSLRD